MADGWQNETSKAKATADAINRILSELVTKCSKEEGIRNYFEVGVIGYGYQVADAMSQIQGPLIKPIDMIDQNPLRMESRKQKIPDGAGGIIELDVKFPVWFNPVANGSTAMCEALTLAGTSIGEWADRNRKAFPPVIINITDGEPTDGDPEPVADLIRQLTTDDGNVLLFNLHISSGGGTKLLFPSSEREITGGPPALRLFRMSSELPPQFIEAATSSGYRLAAGARGYGYNADFIDLVNFLSIGTQAANTRLAR